MFVIRPISKNDLIEFVNLAFKANIGLTSLPKNEERLEKLLHKAIYSFNKKVNSPGYEVYLFVLENTISKKIGGITGIYAKTGENSSLHYYQLKTLPLIKQFHEAPAQITILEPVTYTSGATELCSLYLDSEFRNAGLGKLLSLCRFLFIANFPERFDTTLYALMRSYIDEEEDNPFWNNIGRHFLDISFKTLIARKDAGQDVFPEVLAHYPIIVSLLSPAAKEAIGQVHQNTQPALHMLQNQGFAFNGEIDSIDGGPKIEALRDEIPLIRDSKLAVLSSIHNHIENSPTFIVSNTTINFRCCLAQINMVNKKAVLDKKTANLLNVKIGEHIRFSPLNL
ncbi:Arginine N-succinyltransferase [Chlamydiales bacterium STE3]|nr:Arginine N-succinyltransferase [Chlamydiales bacterium STE3]